MIKAKEDDMSRWTETSERDPKQEHWTSWSRPPKRMRMVNNYMAAGVFSMSAFVVMANFGI